ncbi:hypothetical protein I4U23_031213 [Adineta vaga]|nr:hypothetical protein I4U23_031213 [Adineta vaga]
MEPPNPFLFSSFTTKYNATEVAPSDYLNDLLEEDKPLRSDNANVFPLSSDEIDDVPSDSYNGQTEIVTITETLPDVVEQATSVYINQSNDPTRNSHEYIDFFNELSENQMEREWFNSDLEQDLRFVSTQDENYIKFEMFALPSNLISMKILMRITRITAQYGPDKLFFCHPYPLWTTDKDAKVHHGSLLLDITNSIRNNQQISFKNLIMGRLGQSPLKKITQWPIYTPNQLDCNDFYTLKTNKPKGIIEDYNLRYSILIFQIFLVDDDHVAYPTDLICQSESLFEFEHKDRPNLPDFLPPQRKRQPKRLQQQQSCTMNSNRSINRICQWCSQSIINSGKILNCGHIICNHCVLNDTICQTTCPNCWYKFAEQFIFSYKICSVCCNNLNVIEQPFSCSKNHFHCSQCISQGCILCQFRQLNLGNEINYRDMSVNDQHILYTCQIWVEKFEELQKSLKNNSITISSNTFSNNDEISQFDHQHRWNDEEQHEELGDCMICLEPLNSSSCRRLEICGHSFHQSCIDQWFQSNGKQSCPSCGYVYGISKGPQPSNGQMSTRFIQVVLPGFESYSYDPNEGGTIEITYSFQHGIQSSLNPNPGSSYSGTVRKAYLPNINEGKEILNLLIRAFNDQHIFTIGKSVTTGMDNVITWNDIHHKTNLYGGPDRFGYPDPTYLHRVRQELADKGFK